MSPPAREHNYVNYQAVCLHQNVDDLVRDVLDIKGHVSKLHKILTLSKTFMPKVGIVHFSRFLSTIHPLDLIKEELNHLKDHLLPSEIEFVYRNLQNMAHDSYGDLVHTNIDPS